MTTLVKYEKADDTLVEEIKMKMTTGKKENNMAFAASSTLWSLAVALYLVVSFLNGRWDITWMIFIFAGGLQNLVLAFLNPAAKKKHLSGAYWCFGVLIYLMVSFWSFAWHITWLIFPCIIAVWQDAKLFKIWREEI